VPSGDCAIEPRRIDVGEEQAEGERVGERQLADLACGDLRVQQVAIPDRPRESAVCASPATS
jgi:hypothetical protein